MKTARIELHIHLDGSLNIDWAYKASLRQKIIPADCTFEEYYEMLYKRNFMTRSESIKKFELVCDILQTRADLFDASYRLTETMAKRGIIYAEIRFASQQHTKRGLPQKEALQAVIDGAKAAEINFPSIQTGIINCLMHKGDSAAFNDAENRETIQVTRELLGKGAVGLDLAGYENNCDFKEYAPYFRLAKELGIPFTVHAGEMGVAEHVKDALDFGASRIGHGVNAAGDPELLEELVKRQIPLEVCVTSNIKDTLDYANHPVKKLIRSGAKITLNTDNMIFAKTDLANEHAQLEMIGITENELKQCTYNAVDAAFCDEKTKTELREKLRKLMK